MRDDPRILPPSLRDKKRYIIFKIISNRNFTFMEFKQAMWENLLNFLGEYKSNELDVWLIRNLYDEDKNQGVIRCSHTSIEETRAALTLIEDIEGTNVVVKVQGITGTIKSAKSKYLSTKTLNDF